VVGDVKQREIQYSGLLDKVFDFRDGLDSGTGASNIGGKIINSARTST
jgi:hypothetical protein